MDKHTPGPWTTWKDPENKDLCIYIDAKAKAIAHVFGDNRVSNARIIAAAPDLLAVCKELQESVDYWSEYDVPLGIADRIRAAIAKAEGRS